jgi:alpha-glucosidase (family GH31 glycosyl hydrolase)
VPKPSSRLRLLCLAACLGLPLAASAEPIRLQTGSLTVEIDDPFHLRVLDHDGRVLLDGLGDFGGPVDPLDTYGSVGYAWNQDVTAGKPPYYGYDWYQGVQLPWHHATRILSQTREGNKLSLDLKAQDLRGGHILLTIELLGERSFRLHAEPSDRSVANRMGMSFWSPPEERFFGFGERFYHTEFRGRTLHNWVEDGGFGLGGLEPKDDHDPFPYGPMMTNWPVPFLLSSRGYGLWLDTTYRSTFDLAQSEPSVMRFEVETSQLDWVFFYGPRPLDVLEQYTGLAGRAPLPAPWVFGPRIRSNLERDWPEQIRAAKAGVTGLDTAVHFLPGGGQHGHEDFFRTRIAQLTGTGYKILSYFNNFVSADYHPVYDDGAAAGYFVKTPDGAPYIVGYPGYPKVAMVDFTNPDAVAWYKRLLDESADMGFHGFMYDFAEYVPRDGVFHDGRLGVEAHNEYPVLYQKTAYEELTSKFGTDFCFFARSGYTGSQRYTVSWPGDLDSSWARHNGLPSAIFAGLSHGMTGFPFYGSEIGGYHMIFYPPPDKELFLRWVEVAAYAPLMIEQSDGYSLRGPDTDVRWRWYSDAETLALFAHYTREHTALLPYLYAYAKEASETGAPMMRHLFLEYPDDPAVYGLDTEYLLGRELLVAPVVEQGATGRPVYLPAGRWVDARNGAVFQGPGLLLAAAPLGEVPLYVRSGSIVPKLSADVETLAPAADPGVVSLDKRANILEVHVYPDAQDAARFTLADGTELAAGAAGPELFPPSSVRSAALGVLGPSAGDETGWRMEAGELRVNVDGAADTLEVLGPSGSGSLQVSVQGPMPRHWRLHVHVPQPVQRASKALPAPAGLLLFGLLGLIGLIATAGRPRR